MFKSKQEIIVIQAEAIDPISTGVVFWSHDKGTAKLLFQLKKDNVNQTLAEGTIVPICLIFNGGRHIYHAVIEDALNGIVSIILEDNILGYVGRVDGSIYIELPDSRSLDTAGRFTFYIKRSPIDENVPELEDYYWQGFNEIMAQYHQTIATIKLETKTLLDSLTADVTTAQSKVATLEQSITTANTNLNTRINEINKKIDDNDVFTKQESSANVVYQIIGKDEVEITLNFDLEGKVAGSNVENANSGSFSANAQLLKPSQFTIDLYMDYPKYYALDGNVQRLNNREGTNIAQVLNKFNVVDGITKKLGQKFWTSQGADTLDKKVAIAKNLTTYTNYHVHGFGSSPAGSKLSTGYWLEDLDDYSITRPSNNTNQIEEIVYTFFDTNAKRTISSDGNCYILVYADATDGTTASTINLDYVRFELKLKMSIPDFINSMIAAYSGENINKNFVGLGNVDNYSTATQAEAEAGTDTNKFMTPALVFKAIAKWVQGKFVSTTGNETILGTKNFQDGLQVKGKLPVLTNAATDYAMVDKNNNASVMSSGSLKLYRRGDLVYLTGSFKLSAGKYNQGVWFNIPSWAYPIEAVRMYGKTTGGKMCLLFINQTDNNNIICVDNIAKDSWITISASWMAKNPY